MLEPDARRARALIADAVTAGIAVADIYLRVLAPSRRRSAGAGSAPSSVVSCPTGEQHSLGSQMVADVLWADGWDVRMLGADVPAGDLATFAADEGASLVALSVAPPEHLLATGAACAACAACPTRH